MISTMTQLAPHVAAAAIALAGTTPPPVAEEAGRAEYVENCAACHGMDARGDGPYAAFIMTAPPDLSRLAAENGGQFPFERVYRVIDGRADVPLHGSREMPVWGDEFNEDAKGRFQELLGKDAVENYITRRILALIRYLESIQR